MTHINWQKQSPKLQHCSNFIEGSRKSRQRIPGLSFISQKAFFGQFRFDVKSRSAEFLISSLILTNSYIWNCNGTKNCKDTSFFGVFLHTDFNVGKVMCFCIFILSRSFVFPFYRAGCLPADCTVGLNNFCSKLLSQHLHGLDIYLKSNHYLSNMTKMLTLPQKERGSKFCNFEPFFSYCKYLKGGTHQGSVSNLIFTETFE